MKTKLIVAALLAAGLVGTTVYAQEQGETKPKTETKMKAKHHSMKAKHEKTAEKAMTDQAGDTKPMKKAAKAKMAKTHKAKAKTTDNTAK